MDRDEIDGAEIAAEDRKYDGPETLRLRRPLTFPSSKGEAKVIDELVIRPLCGAFMRGLPDNATDRALMLLARMADQPAKVIDRLEGFDLMEAMKIVAGFQGAFQGTGRTA